MTETFNATDPSVRELPLAAGGELELRLGSNRLRVRTVDGDRLVIRGRTDHDLERDVEITAGAGWVRVDDGPAGSLRLGPLTVRNGGHTPDLDVDVPRNVRISARTLSGDIMAVGIAGPSKWQSASGSIRVGADGGPLVIETVSGDAIVDARAALAVTVRTVSGSARIHAPRIQALDVATTSGDVTVDAALDPDAGHTLTSVSGDVRLATGSELTVDFQSVTGDVRASMAHRVDGTRGRRTIVIGSGRVHVGVRTMSGDLKLKPGTSDPASSGAADAAGSASTWRDDAGTGRSAWVDFGRDWAAWAADWAKEWAAWGAAWASGKSWGPPTGSEGRPTPAAPGAPVEPEPPAPDLTPAPDAAAGSSSADQYAASAASGADDARPPFAPEPAPAAQAAGSLEDTAPVEAVTPADVEAARLEILRSLERGELDVEAAAERLAALEGVAGRPEA